MRAEEVVERALTPQSEPPPIQVMEVRHMEMPETAAQGSWPILDMEGGVSVYANIMAVGKFSEAAAEHLEHPAVSYSKTRPGTQVFSVLFVTATSETSQHLAKAVGAELWDFNTHRIDPAKVDVEALRDVEVCSGSLGDVERFLALRALGFHFFLRLE